MTQEEKIDHILRKVDKIDRGLYGDVENKQEGLMQKHYEVATRVKDLEDQKTKAIYWGTGLFAGLALTWEVIKKWMGL